jgi:hypothetical protein
LLTRRPVTAAPAAFTVVEAVVGLGLVALVGAIVVASMSDFDRHRRVTDDVEVLRDLTEAISKFDTGVTVFPRNLMHLTTRPVATDLNSCGAAFGATNVTNWTNTGPFYTQSVVDPIDLEIGSLSATTSRTGATTATSPGVLSLSITNVDSADAVEVNRQVDGDAASGSSTTGVIRFALPAAGKTTVTWNIAIRGC